MSIPGKLRRTSEGYRTFVPDPLPPQIILSADTARMVEEATHLLGQVEMCRTLLPNANLLIYSSLRREALASSTIEGTITSPDALIRFQASRREEHGPTREVSNYQEALEWGYLEMQKRPLAGSLTLGLHARLLDGVRGAGVAGRFKDRQNYIGKRSNDPISRAIFVPPAPSEVPALIRALEEYINGTNQEARVVQCALAHYQFETIHPFNDGNGRVGRLLIILQLIQLGLLSAPLIYPSVFFERRREDYNDRLQAVREEGAWDDWVGFFAQGMRQQAQETIELTRIFLNLREYLREQVKNVSRRASVNAVLDAFFQDPVLSLRDVVLRARMARHSAQVAVDVLLKEDILLEITGKRKGRVYACRPVLETIFGGYSFREPDAPEEG